MSLNVDNLPSQSLWCCKGVRTLDDDQLTPYIDISKSIRSPSPYVYESSKVVGDFISSWGWKSSNLMPWHAEAKSYKNERKATETEFLSGGGKIIFPFPEIEVI